MTNIVSGLLKKRIELVALLSEQEKALQQTKASVNALDATIRLYHPEHELDVIGPARRKSTKYFDFGEITPLVRDFFREWDQERSPTTNDAIYALAQMKAIDYDALDKARRQAFYKSILHCLKRGVTNGWLIEHYRDQGMIHWKLVG